MMTFCDYCWILMSINNVAKKREKEGDITEETKEESVMMRKRALTGDDSVHSIVTPVTAIFLDWIVILYFLGDQLQSMIFIYE